MLAAGIIFSVLALIFGGHAVARQPAHARFHAERMELRAGYGWQYTNEVRPNNFQIIPVMPSAVIPLSESAGPSRAVFPSVLRGRWEWNPELFLGGFQHPYLRPILGVTPLQFRYALTPKGRFTPYGLIGTGILYANVNRRETRSDLNFNIQEGLGTYITLTPRTDLILEYRHIHISNAGVDEDNTGINAHTFLVGLSLKR